MQSRLASEYGVETRLDRLTFRSLLWVPAGRPAESLSWPTRGAAAVRDRDGRVAGLFEGSWAEEGFRERNPGVELVRTL